MTVISFADCERSAGRIVATRMGEGEFRTRIEKRSSTWQLEISAFLSQVQTIIAMGLWNAYRSSPTPLSEEVAAGEALVRLRNEHDLELFAALPEELDGAENAVKQLRLISAGPTAKTAVLWARLAETARNFLDPAAQYG